MENTEEIAYIQKDVDGNVIINNGYVTCVSEGIKFFLSKHYKLCK